MPYSRVKDSYHEVILITLRINCGIGHRGYLAWKGVISGRPKEAGIEDIIAGLV